jgi:NitT/TauT family transport system permease protein
LLVWELAARSQEVPTFFLPKPSDVAQRFARALADGILTRHLLYTWSEALVAFGLAFLLSTSLGYVLAKSPLLERVVSPFIIASQALPIFAIAPFVLILFGNGFWSNALMGALVAFFPMLVNNISALRNIGDEQREVMQSFAASARQVFAKLEVPATLPYLFGSMRVGITLAVIGVLVVELFWADRGIGFLLNFARGQFDTPLLFAGILALILMNLTMYGILALLQRIVMPWRYSPQ